MEEVGELVNASNEEEYKEAVDVLITVLVYAEISGFLNKIEPEFDKKMLTNLAKPVRKGREKVRKS